MVRDAREHERLIQELIEDAVALHSIDVTFSRTVRELSVYISRVGYDPIELIWTPETLLHVVERTGIIDVARLEAALSQRRTGALLISRSCTQPIWKNTSYK